MISKSLLERSKAITEAMNRIGLKVVDVAIYTTDYIDKKAKELVIVGYIPNYAAIYSVHTGASGDMTFIIDGQVRNIESFAPASKHRFDKISRPVNAGELFGKLDFSINIYLPSIGGGDLLEKGMSFFESFTQKYLKFLESKFTENVMLHVANVHSDEYKAFESRYGVTSLKGQEYFENRIKKKLPRGFFPV